MHSLYLPFKPAKAQDPPRRQRQHVQSFVHQEKFWLQASGCAEYEATAPIPLACKHLQKVRFFNFCGQNKVDKKWEQICNTKKCLRKIHLKKINSMYCDCTDISLWFLAMFILHALWLYTISWSQDKSLHLHNDCSLNWHSGGGLNRPDGTLFGWRSKILLHISVPKKSW